MQKYKNIRVQVAAPLSHFFLLTPLSLPFFSFSFPPFLPFTISPWRRFPKAGAEPVSPPCLSLAPTALWRERAPSPPGHKRRQVEEPDLKIPVYMGQSPTSTQLRGTFPVAARGLAEAIRLRVTMCDRPRSQPLGWSSPGTN